MDRDWGSRDRDFIALTAELRERLLGVANAADTHVAVPIQGAGTYALEAAAASLLRPTDRLLALVNGAYGRRMVEIARRLGRQVEVIEEPEDVAIQPDRVREALARDPGLSHVSVVHVETTTGLLNPLAEVAAEANRAGRRLIVDAMASFGALPLDLQATPVDVVLASSNKALEGAPGLAFALVERGMLEQAQGVSPSMSLDLAAQASGFARDGQWRFTPPVQVVAGLVEALKLLDADGARAGPWRCTPPGLGVAGLGAAFKRLEAAGGPPAGRARYAANLATLVDGVVPLGFPLFLPRELQAPIIATFRHGAAFDFPAFYDALGRAGFVIYPGKLTRAASFRIGCIGQVFPSDMERLVQTVGDVLGC